ncbi:IS21 family transposase [Phocaeicola sp.]
MQKLRQVLRFYSQGKGTKTISSIVGISRNTVKKYLQIFHTLHMDFEDVVCLGDSHLSELFSLTPKPVVHDSRYAVLEPLLPSYCKRLRHKGMSRRKLYQEYISEHPDGYSLASFDRFIQRHVGMSSPVMHLEHKAGDKLSIVDADSGEIIPVEVFVAILPCSQLTYVEAVMSQKKEDLITVCEASLHYIGGTPLAIVPDNLKAAVTKSSRYEAILNDDFASFAEHYGCAVMPARAYKPRDKALVEGAVKLIYSSIYPCLEGRVFHDLPTLNAAIRVALEIHNNMSFVGRNYSRREQFEEIERPALGKLNPIRYELRKSTVLTVMKNGHVRLG